MCGTANKLPVFFENSCCENPAGHVENASTCWLQGFTHEPQCKCWHAIRQHCAQWFLKIDDDVAYSYWRAHTSDCDRQANHLPCVMFDPFKLISANKALEAACELVFFGLCLKPSGPGEGKSLTGGNGGGGGTPPVEGKGTDMSLTPVTPTAFKCVGLGGTVGFAEREAEAEVSTCAWSTHMFTHFTWKTAR